MPRVPSPAALQIGERVKAHRIQLAMTQDELGAACGIDSSNIRSYENGRSMMNLFSLVRIAEALGVEPGELIEGVTSAMFPTQRPDARRSRPIKSTR